MNRPAAPSSARPSLGLLLLALATACSVSGPTSEEATLPSSAAPARSACPDLSGRYASTSPSGDRTERIVTQSRCEQVRIQDTTWAPGRAAPVRSDRELAADQVCRDLDPAGDASPTCEAYWFTRSALISEIVRRPSGTHDREYRAERFKLYRGAAGDLIEEREHLRPDGSTAGRDQQAWAPSR